MKNLVEVRIEGLEELQINSKRVSDAIKKGIAQSLKLSGVLVEGDAKRIAPVDTGLLRLRIYSKSDDKSAQILTGVEYGPYVELGTSRQTAQPFLRPALLRNVNNIKTVFQSVIGKNVEVAVRVKK